MKGSRPDKLVVVVGTGTDVGKTWVSAALLTAARAAGNTTAARKPAQSFEAGNDPTDADLLGGASGEDAGVICPPHRWYEVPYAPPMAADSLGRPVISQDDLYEELEWPFERIAFGLVEMAGGVASPISHDGGQVDLLAMLEPDHVVLVADAGLGTINAVKLSLRWLSPVAGSQSGAGIVTVLNRFEPESELHRRNLDWLSRDGVNALPSEFDDPEIGRDLLRRITPS